MERTNSFGYWLRRRRRALDLTQDELAQQVGCAVGTIKKLEGDERRPSKQLAERLADLLRLAPEERAAFLKAARAELTVDQLDVATQPIEAPGGHTFKTVGDAFCAAFATASDALAAALAAQRALQAERWGATGPLRVRMALHTGAAEVRDGDYFGHTLSRAARIRDAGHG